MCGEDRHTGQNFEHRRGWVADKLKSLSSLFAIDIAAYAVMNNHYHLVLHVDKETAEAWTNKEVAKRWNALFSLPVIVSRFLNRESLSSPELTVVDEIIETWRYRLYDISWYMRIFNEHIAREANKEDKVTGRFWEGRFKSQALLDEQALITCMAYVDLNPVRAGIAKTPEESEFTSIKDRLKQSVSNKPNSHLLPFQD